MSIAKRIETTSGDVDITPLLDVMFLLVIFFMVATSFNDETHAIDIDLPRAVNPRILTLDDRVMTVSISAEGRHFLNDRELEPERLFTALESASAEGRVERVLIKADATADYRYIAELLDVLSIARIDGISFAVQYSEF